ncbi:Fic family protein, partial [Rothia mucilaginosa]|uniref:Fic/DOC family protein n=1 Tax=Rothia mucilaginosa TaxID=43675 RepID=UPI0028DC7418
LFQDVYDWAGEYRTVDMSKGVSAFASVQRGPMSIDRYLDYVFSTSRATDWASLNHQEFVEAAAAIFAHLNHAHPFREGNGRATRIFMDHVAARSDFRFDYARAGRRGWNQSSMFSGPDRGYFEVHPEELYQLFSIITVPRDA